MGLELPPKRLLSILEAAQMWFMPTVLRMRAKSRSIFRNNSVFHRYITLLCVLYCFCFRLPRLPGDVANLIFVSKSNCRSV